MSDLWLYTTLLMTIWIVIMLGPVTRRDLKEVENWTDIGLDLLASLLLSISLTLVLYAIIELN